MTVMRQYNYIMIVPSDGFMKDIDIQDMRWLSIIMHQLVENHIDMIINLAFKHPLITTTTRNPNFGFKEKTIIAKALGLFDGKDGKNLEKNVKIIQTIRNNSAHNLDQTSGKLIPSPLASQIKEMYNFFPPDIMAKEDDPLFLVFRVRCMSTIAELNRIKDLRQEIKKKVSELDPVIEKMEKEMLEN